MQNFHKKLSQSNMKSQENSTYIFYQFQHATIITKIPQNYQETCMKIFRIFRAFLDTKIYKTSQDLTKIGNN
jgi:hypothetical protein